MSETTPLRCSSCGDTFVPSAELLARFPGWTPRTCTRCYRGSSRSAPRSGSRSRARFAGEEQLTLAEVLDKYRDGPDTGVFTDGSASPNPGPGGWGAVYVVDGEVIATDHGSEPHTTNNRMELTALLRGIELVPAGTPATVYSDSNLAVRTVNEWAAGWAKRGWRRKTGPVENLDLVQPLYEAVSARPELELRWIKAHAGNRWNEYADSLATAYARERL
ncbi:ribonuclease H [Egicoccus sp. AB-alg6-2]|uniref:ribonuclease H family protein n=1 Tax=Egicoccus sp. AB-alg6-2 TaxID=3242692 RepID=UPI00359DB814